MLFLHTCFNSGQASFLHAAIFSLLQIILLWLFCFSGILASAICTMDILFYCACWSIADNSFLNALIQNLVASWKKETHSQLWALVCLLALFRHVFHRRFGHVSCCLFWSHICSCELLVLQTRQKTILIVPPAAPCGKGKYSASWVCCASIGSLHRKC